MKVRSLSFALAITLLPPCLFAQSAPIDQTEILGRLGAGYAPSYIAHLVKTCGVNFSPSQSFVNSVKLAGGDGILVERLSSAQRPGLTSISSGSEGPLDHLARCAELIHTGAAESADFECRTSVDESPKSPWPLLLVVRMSELAPDLRDSVEPSREKQEEEVRLLQRAASLAPNLSAVHSALARYVPPTDRTRESQNSRTLDPEGLDATEAWFPSGIPAGGASVATRAQDSVAPVIIDPETLRRIKIDPDLATNQVALANHYCLQICDFELAQSEYVEAIRLEPDSPILRSSFAFFLLSRNHPDEALAQLREAVRIAPSGTFQRMMLAGVLESLGHTAEAGAELRQLISIHPTELVPSSALVEFYLDHKDYQSAIGELRRSLDVTSRIFSDQSHFVDLRLNDIQRLAELLKGNREFAAAAEQYSLLLRFRPDESGIHNDYGNVLFELHRIDGAIDEYNEALRLDPTMSAAHNNLGLCLADKRNLRDAIAEFRRTLELNPNEPNTRMFLGTALGQTGDLAGARKQLQLAIEESPKDPIAHVQLAYALDKFNETMGAINELKLALSLKPDSVEAENDLAWLYATTKNPKFRNPTDALILARRAVGSSPQPVPAYLDTLAEALLLNGHPADALATETEAARLDPENPELQSRLQHFRQAANSHFPSRPE